VASTQQRLGLHSRPPPPPVHFSESESEEEEDDETDEEDGIAAEEGYGVSESASGSGPAAVEDDNTVAETPSSHVFHQFMGGADEEGTGAGVFGAGADGGSVFGTPSSRAEFGVDHVGDAEDRGGRGRGVSDPLMPLPLPPPSPTRRSDLHSMIHSTINASATNPPTTAAEESVSMGTQTESNTTEDVANNIDRLAEQNAARMEAFGFASIEEVHQAIQEERRDMLLLSQQARESEAAAMTRVEVQRLHLQAEEKQFKLKCEQQQQVRVSKTDMLLSIAGQLKEKERQVSAEQSALDQRKAKIDAIRQRLRRMNEEQKWP